MTKQKNHKLQTWHIILLVGILLTALVLGILQSMTVDDATTSGQPEPSDIILNEMTCRDSGGTWNECGSACRENPDVPCIEVCVSYCECTADDQCPFGLACGSFVDGVGICE